MTTTAKNWLTTFGGSILMGAAGYFFTPANEPGATDGWQRWKVALIGALLAGLFQAYHAYQPQSGKKGPDGAAGGSAGSSSSPTSPPQAKPPNTIRLAALALALLTSGCLSSAPLVPVTPANQTQITACQNTATLHNAVVIGGFVLSGTTAGLAGAAAALPDPNTKTTLGVIGASVGGVALVSAAIGELTNSNFQNSQCGNVVGPLPTAPNPASQSTAPATSPPAAGK